MSRTNRTPVLSIDAHGAFLSIDEPKGTRRVALDSRAPLPDLGALCAPQESTEPKPLPPIVREHEDGRITIEWTRTNGVKVCRVVYSDHVEATMNGYVREAERDTNLPALFHYLPRKRAEPVPDDFASIAAALTAAAAALQRMAQRNA